MSRTRPRSGARGEGRPRPPELELPARHHVGRDLHVVLRRPPTASGHVLRPVRLVLSEQPCAATHHDAARRLPVVPIDFEGHVRAHHDTQELLALRRPEEQGPAMGSAVPTLMLLRFRAAQNVGAHGLSIWARWISRSRRSSSRVPVGTTATGRDAWCRTARGVPPREPLRTAEW